MEMESLPGWELIGAGIQDLERGVESASALLVAIGEPRLRRAGIAEPVHGISSPEHRLYLLLASTEPEAAHSRYNALLGRLARAYFTGGSTAVLHGWRDNTVDIDLSIEGESGGARSPKETD